MRQATPLLALLALAAPASAAEPDAVVRDLTDDVALPVVRGFAEEASRFETAVGEACADPSAPDREALEAAHADLATAYARAEVLSFGPLNEDNRGFKIAFWPDKHGTAARQVRQTLAAADPEAVTPDALADASVALQGLPAVEQVLHGQEGGPLGAFDCAFLQGLAGNVVRLAVEVEQAWAGGYAERLTGGEIADDPLVEYYRAVDDALVKVIDVKLGRPMGGSAKDANGALAEAAAAGLPIDLILANLATVEALSLGEGGLGLANALPEGEAERLRATLNNRFGVAEDALSGLAVPFEDAVADPDARSELEVARYALGDAQQALRASVGDALGFSVGFNSADGD